MRYSKSGTSQSDASGASTPLFPNLFPREEGNITSQRGGGSGPSNGLDEPESRPGLIRVSTFDSIDGGAKHKEHATFLDHHPRSISAILDPTFLPDMIQSVSTSANETPDVGSSLKDKQSRSVSLESDLELTVPTPLNQGKPPYAASVLPQEPFTQVKRTPYANGHLHEDPLDWSRSQSSPLRPVADCHSGALADNVGCVKLSLPSASEISSVKSRDNQRNEVIVESQKDLGDRTFSMSDEQTKPQTKLNNSRPHGLGNHSRIPKTMKTLIDGGKDAPQQPTTSQNIVTGSPVSGNREMKRKVFDGSFGFPDVVKRRKRFEILTAFNLAADPDSRRDPTEGARQFRQEFLASRRSSESSNPRESPTITSPVGSSWTIPALKNQEVEMRDKSRELHLQDSSTVPNYEVEHTIYKEALSTGDQEPQPTEIDTESTVPGSSIVAASFSSKYLGAPLDVQGPTSPGHRHDVLLHETQDRENIKVPTPSPSDVGPVGLESTEALPRLLNPVSPGHSVDIPMPETQDLNEQIESTVSKLPNTDPVGLETSDALPRVQDPPFSDKIADVPMPDTQERGEHVESTIKALISVKPADSETDEALPGAQNHTFPDHHSLIFNSDAKDQVADMDSSDFSTAKHPSPADVLDLRTIGILPSAQDSTSPILNATSTVSLVKDQVENLSSPPPTSPLLEEKSNPETNDAPSGAQNHISHNDGADDDVFDAEDQTEMTHPSISTFAHVMNFIDLETSGTLPVAQNSASLDHSVDMSISNAQNRIEVTPTVITFPNAEGTSAAEIPDVQVNTSASHSADYTPSGARDEIVLDNPEDVMTPVEITSCSPGLDVQRAQSVELVLSAHQKNQEGINMDHRSLQAEDGSTVEYEAKLSRITSGPNQVPDIHLDDELHDQQHPVGDANIFSEDAPGQGCNAPTLELPSILSLEPGTSVSGPHPQSLRSVNVGIDILMTEGKPNEAIRPLLEIKPSLPHEEQPISQVRPVLPKSPEQPPVNSPSVEECTSLNFDLPKANPRATEEREQPATVSVEQDAQKHSGTARNIFDKFKAAYPDYSGDQKHFIAICKKISILLNANRMEHPSLWDDFIVRHKMDYSRHLRRCVELAEDALPYEEFYRDKIEEPQYQKRVVTRCNLEEVLSLADSYLGPIKRATKPIDHTKPQQPVVKQISRREIPKTTTQNPVEMRVTIDLTEDDQEIEDNEMPERAHIASPACTNTKVRRPLPWVEPINGNRVPAVQASLGSLHGEPFAGHFDAKISKVNCLGAETPHCNVSTDSSVLSKTNTLSKLPIEAKGFLNQQRNQERIQANITGDIAQGALRPSNGKPTTFAEQIETSWGVRADSVLQPKHYDVDTLTPRVMELLAEISLMTDVVEARNMIKMQIRTHSWKTGHGQKIRPEYLEAVKSNLKTRQRSVDSDEQGHEDRTSSKSSMRTTGPSSLPQASVAIEQMDDGMPSGWWKDGNTPFKTFARAYASIQNGNGNSFAKPNSAEKGHAGRTQRVGSDGTELRKIDILRWKLERY